MLCGVEYSDWLVYDEKELFAVEVDARLLWP